MYLITYWVLLEFPVQAQVQVAYAQFIHETFNTATSLLGLKCVDMKMHRDTEQCSVSMTAVWHPPKWWGPVCFKYYGF